MQDTLEHYPARSCHKARHEHKALETPLRHITVNGGDVPSVILTRTLEGVGN